MQENGLNVLVRFLVSSIGYFTIYLLINVIFSLVNYLFSLLLYQLRTECFQLRELIIT